jgi:EAL domain-containing protein (putative c-di-GMP-specific phosphodiesterase class I)/ABC-type amino acid transport substrate-binding protein
MLLLLASADVAAQPEGGVLRVGGDSAYPPFEWATPEGELRGFNVELVRLLAEPAGVEVDVRLDAWPETVAALDEGRLDVVPMFASDERRQRYRFTNIFYYQTHALFARPELPPVEGTGQLGELQLVVEARSFAQDMLAARGLGESLRLSNDTREALRMVADGRADYALLAAPVAAELIRRNEWDLERKSAPFWPRGYAFAVLREREALAEWIQARLVEVMSNGDYLALYENWSDRLEPGPKYPAQAIEVALWVVAVLLAALLLIVAWNWSLRRKVHERTRLLADELDQRERAEREARDLARRDPITSLSNVRHFCGLGERIVSRNAASEQTTEIMLIRLLETESVVRSFGYRIAERMILGFSEALARTFEPPVGHLGRGTFAVIDAEGRAHERLDRLERTVRQGDAPVHPRFVAGSAFHPTDEGDINDLLQKAELALAESESRQCRWTRFGSHLQSDPVDLEVIDSARAERFEGLDFVLQPQLRLDDRSLIGGELLARWDHPSLGPIEPGRFVPLLEQAGLVGRLTKRALQTALGALEQLDRQGARASLSINVSARDLGDPAFSGRVVELLRASTIPAGALKAEITETSLVGDPENARKTLDELAGAGVVISLDDFGKGYSSLDYISRFPIREVKIDRSFISRLGDSERVLSIVRSTIALAHEMDISVVGEGAETRAQVERLADLGCDLAQGWAIGVPGPRSEWLERIAAGVRPGRTRRA